MPVMIRLCLIALVLGFPLVASSEVVPAPIAHAVRRAGPVHVDGRLDEAAWTTAPLQGDLTQRFPADGARATQATRFALLYDDDAVYVGVWADDADPGRITRRLAPRDVDGPNDSITACIDTIAIAAPRIASSSRRAGASATAGCSTTRT